MLADVDDGQRIRAAVLFLRCIHIPRGHEPQVGRVRDKYICQQIVDESMADTHRIELLHNNGKEGGQRGQDCKGDSEVNMDDRRWIGDQ